MIALVTGGRDFTDDKRLYRGLDLLNSRAPIDCVVHGGARGADTIAGQWATDRHVPFMVFHADWKHEGKVAGPLRNARMVGWCIEQQRAYQDVVVLAAPGGNGTKHCVTTARERGLKVVYLTDLAPLSKEAG